MSKLNKLLALVLALSMVFALAACGSSNANAPAEEEPVEEETAAEEPVAEEPAEKADTLVVGYSPFNSKFSPFFSDSAYDADVYAMTQVNLLSTDRTGAPVEKGIDGTTIEYNGTDYTYYGPADLTITENEDGTFYWDFTLRDDIVFSDGEPMTIDDLIFSLYVECDPTYEGGATLYASPIQGMEEYRSGMDTLLNLIFNAGYGNTDFTYFTEEQQTEFWDKYIAATTGLAQEIVDYCVAEGYAEEGDIIGAAEAWGFEPAENTIESFALALSEAYGSDINNMITTENAGSTTEDLFPGLEEYSVGVETGESAPNISGIQRIDDYNLRIVATGVDAQMIYQLTLAIAPMHYYGDPDLYDYENNSFGFPKGDLSSVRAKTTEPMGAGPYKFVKFENGIVSFEANDSYYLGAPKTRYLKFRECLTEDDKLNGVTTGDLDITDPSYSLECVDQLTQLNNGEGVTGDVITTNTVDNLGYGYIGISANNVNVSGEPGSDASKALRKGIATVISAYRELGVDSYYGETATVINYPISNTSWAAPRPSDDDYKVAFSTDAEGNDIYSSSMSAEDKYEAAKQAALGWFAAAGFTVEDGKVVAAPEGAKMEYDLLIPAGGEGDHPAFMIAVEASNALKEIGFNLNVKDIANFSEMLNTVNSGQAELWAMAWGATPDPDMYQVYFSGDDVNPAGKDADKYGINDAELNQLILDARKSTDRVYRKAMYKACLDIIIDWACEIPTYQRQNVYIFSTERVDIDSLTTDMTPYYDWRNEIQNVEMN